MQTTEDDEAQIAAVIADNCCRMSIAHSTYRTLGFSHRRPRRFIRDVCWPQWKRELSVRIHRQSLFLFSAAHLQSLGTCHEAVLNNLVSFYFSDDGRFEAICPTRNACVNEIYEYLRRIPADWHEPLWEKLQLTTIPDKRLIARLTLGCIQLAQVASGIMLEMRVNGIRRVS